MDRIGCQRPARRSALRLRPSERAWLIAALVAAPRNGTEPERPDLTDAERREPGLANLPARGWSPLARPRVGDRNPAELRRRGEGERPRSCDGEAEPAGDRRGLCLAAGSERVVGLPADLDMSAGPEVNREGCPRRIAERDVLPVRVRGSAPLSLSPPDPARPPDTGGCAPTMAADERRGRRPSLRSVTRPLGCSTTRAGDSACLSAPRGLAVSTRNPPDRIAAAGRRDAAGRTARSSRRTNAERTSGSSLPASMARIATCDGRPSVSRGTTVQA